MMPNHNSLRYPPHHGLAPPAPTKKQFHPNQHHHSMAMAEKTEGAYLRPVVVSTQNSMGSSLPYCPSTFTMAQHNSAFVHPHIPPPPAAVSTFIPGVPNLVPLRMTPLTPLLTNFGGISSSLAQGGPLPYSLPHATQLGTSPHVQDNRPRPALHTSGNPSDLDLDFVKTFEENIKSRDQGFPKVDCGVKQNSMSLSKAQDLLNSIERLQEGIATLRDYLTDNMRISDEQWTKTTEKIRKLKESLDINQTKLTSPNVVQHLQKKIQERRKRRDRIRRKKLLAKKEGIAMMIERMKRHREIDEWQHKIKLKDKANRMVESLRSEAGETLSEVRKKKADVDRFASKLKSLLELRTIRRQTSLSRGIFVFEDDDEAFEAKVNKSLENIETRRKTYQEEETALLVMMEEEREEFKRVEEEKRKKRLKEEEEKAANDPLLPYKNYWLQAEESIEALVNVRRAWDAFISPPNLIGASRIPDGWVNPPEPSDRNWGKYCQRQGKRIS